MLPGVEIVSDKTGIIGLIESRSNPKRLPPIEVLRQARPVGREVFDSEFFSGDKLYYVLYEHPILEGRDKLHLARKEELLPFLQTRIHPERGEGLDITVTSQDDVSGLLICNHDGEMFLLPALGIGDAGAGDSVGESKT